jgi:general secretion pathway protein G
LNRDIGVAHKAKDRICGPIHRVQWENRWPVFCEMRAKKTRRGFTVIELMIAMAIMVILATMASMVFSAYRERANASRAVLDIRTIQNAISSFQIVQGRLPDDLAEVHLETLKDPWDHPYQYTNFETAPKGKWRKDKFLVPINSAYDLWSMGPDGKSLAPLVAPVSKDDIIRANDGLFIGRASLY